MSSSVSIDLFRNGFAQVAELALPAKPEDALDYPSSLVQQYGIRQAAVVIGGFHVASTHQNWKRWPELGDKGAHLGVAHVVGDSGDVEILTVEVPVKLRHVRKLRPARLAPRRPEVHERHLAAVIVEPYRLSGQIGQRERRLEQIAPAGRDLREQRLGIEHSNHATAVHRDRGRWRTEHTPLQDLAGLAIQHVAPQSCRGGVLRAENIEAAVRADGHGDVDERVLDAPLLAGGKAWITPRPACRRPRVSSIHKSGALPSSATNST